MKYLKIISIAMMLPLLAISCKKKPNPKLEVPQEELDDVQVHFILLDDNQEATSDTTSIIFDNVGQANVDLLTVYGGKKYLMLIDIFNEEESINDEIIEDGDMHQFFFIPSDSGLITSFEYLDEDQNGRAIGLKNKIEWAATEITADFKIILRHGLDKSHENAVDFNDLNYRNAGGEDDLQVSFEIKTIL